MMIDISIKLSILLFVHKAVGTIIDHIGAINHICDMIKRNESLVENISIPIFLHHFNITSKCSILMQTPLQLDIWLQSYKAFVNAKNNIKQRNLNTVFTNISKTIWTTSDSFLLIMSHNYIMIVCDIDEYLLSPSRHLVRLQRIFGSTYSSQFIFITNLEKTKLRIVTLTLLNCLN